MLKEKQKNKIIFECHHTPKSLKDSLNNFLETLRNDDTFLLEIKKSNLSINYFEINFLNEEEIQSLNKKFRNIGSSTDVLSFNNLNIGEIDLCLPVIEANANQLYINFMEELQRCIIHGCLHILGYDHESKLTPENIQSEPMFLIQEHILSDVTPSSL